MTVQSPHRPQSPRRRQTLRVFGGAAFVLAAPWVARASTDVRSLSFYHTHTDEHLRIDYFASGAYVPEALASLTRLLRDFRTEQSHEIDARLFDTLHALNGLCGAGTFEIISGYRSPATNAMLRSHGGGGVASHSLHMQGRAIDVRLAGRDTRALRDAALKLAQGGVGYYAKSDFVHVDTGAPRTW
jgi:uncharacterized protein YcbK (DUF882 family)